MKKEDVIRQIEDAMEDYGFSLLEDQTFFKESQSCRVLIQNDHYHVKYFDADHNACDYYTFTHLVYELLGFLFHNQIIGYHTGKKRNQVTVK